jgi:carbon starvation protein
VAILLIVLGVIVAHPVISAPAINQRAFASGSDVPDLMPVLFIIIACGAISGFHSIAGSGTTVKQIKNETDTFFISYGGMLTEGFLAVLVIICVAAGLGMGFEKGGEMFTGREAYFQFYSSWTATNNSGIGTKLSSFIIGSANFLKSIGIPVSIGQPMVAVFIVSFANTTLDSATRMQRLSLQELFRSQQSGKVLRPFRNRYVATLLVVLLASVMTFLKPGGKGALLLWPLFGSLNQLLAALGLAVVSIYLIQKRKNYLLALIPMIFVLIMTIWSMFTSLLEFVVTRDYLLVALSLIILILAIWLLIEGVRSVVQKKNIST